MANDDKPKLPKRLYYRLSEAAEYLTKNGLECSEADLLHFGAIGECKIIFSVPDGFQPYIESRFDEVDEYVEVISEYLRRSSLNIKFFSLHQQALFIIEVCKKFIISEVSFSSAFLWNAQNEFIEVRRNFRDALKTLFFRREPPFNPSKPFDDPYAPYDNADVFYCLKGDGYCSDPWSFHNNESAEESKKNAPNITIDNLYITKAEIERMQRGKELTATEKIEMMRDPSNCDINNEVFERGIVLWSEGEQKGYGAGIAPIAKKIVDEFAAESPPRLNQHNQPYTITHIERMLSGLKKEYFNRKQQSDNRTVG